MTALRAAPLARTMHDARGRALRDLRISVTDRCNFRCAYCMPADVFDDGYTFLPRPDLLREDEIARLARVFVDLGVQKIRLTGGEPLIRPDLPAIVARLADLDGLTDLALTTNGLLLAKQAAALKAAGLRRITVSLDSVDPGVFRRMTGRDLDLAPVLAGLDAAVAAGLRPIKINCVVQRGVNDHTVLDLARYFRGTNHIVRFIEYMDVGTLNGWELAHTVPAQEIVERISAVLPLMPVARHYPGEVATRYRYIDGSGEIGVIASVTDPFCGDCTRARLSADGQLVTCLFSGTGRDLRGPLRAGATDDELCDLIADVWTPRADRYSEERTDRLAAPQHFIPVEKIEMYQIGG